jgi:hypothetical protein
MLIAEKVRDTIDEIEKLMSGHSLEENLEIIGNILVREGACYLEGIDCPGSQQINTEVLIKSALKDREKYGETIANATVLQGLTLLTWLKET